MGWRETWQERPTAILDVVVRDVVGRGRSGTVLDKVSGTVAYAAIKAGGMFANHHHYPVRWDALRFEPARQAFVVELTLEDLRAGPSEFDEDEFDWGDRSRSYPHPHYWTV